MFYGETIRELYFDYQGIAGHFPGCSASGNAFEVTQHRYRRLGGEVKRTTLRLACFECGSVFFAAIDGDWPSTEHTSADQVGYGSKPEKVLGLWLWPGPRIWHNDERGPHSYYLTRSAERPRSRDDVLGVVGWHFGSRGGLKWDAGVGLTDHGSVLATTQNLSSRRAAVAWVIEQSGGRGLPLALSKEATS